MYARFIRWASDRIGENGVIAFIVNRSFIDSRTFDGFRKVVAEEFGEIYVVDLGGDVRANPKLSGTRNNVFGIQTGVAIVYFVKTENGEGKANVYYVRRPEMETAKEKLQWIDATNLEQIPFKHITPNKRHVWVNQAENEWDSLLPIASKKAKATRAKSAEQAMFKFYSTGTSTNRDEWVYDVSSATLGEKMAFFSDFYDKEWRRWLKEGQVKWTNAATDKEQDIGKFLNTTIKWSRNLKRRFIRGSKETFKKERIQAALYRPYFKPYFYNSDIFIDEKGVGEMFQLDNIMICFSGLASSKPFQCLVSKKIPSLDLLEKTQCLPLYRYDKHGNRLDNITDWGLKKFQEHYGKVRMPGNIAL